MNKIQAIEKTIYNLENDVYEYNWQNADKCNCGILARTLLGGQTASECGLRESPKLGDNGVFAKYAYCMTTNLSLPLVFQTLKEAGFTHQELLELEYLGNDKIADRMGFKTYTAIGGYKVIYGGIDIKTNLISYLKAWVEILKEQEPKPESQKHTEKVKEVIKYVSVPESITEQAMKLMEVQS